MGLFLLFFPSFLTFMSDHCLGNEVINSGQFIVSLCFLLSDFLQQVNAHLLLTQAHIESQGLCLSLVLDLGDLLVCQFEFLFYVGLQHSISRTFLFKSYYVILNTLQ